MVDKKEDNSGKFNTNLFTDTGALLYSGIDVQKVALDDEAFAKYITRRMIADVFIKIDEYLNEKPKLLYDKLIALTIWLKPFSDSTFMREIRDIKKDAMMVSSIGSKNVQNQQYIILSEKLLNSIIDLMSRLGWFVVTKEVITSAISKDPEKEIEEYMKYIEEEDKKKELAELSELGLDKKVKNGRERHSRKQS